MGSSPLLTVRDLAIRIEGRPILRCEEFTLRQGDKVLLTSRSGGGKSVFLKCLAGLLPLHVVERGTFHPGEGAAGVTYAQYARRRSGFAGMGFVFQDAYNALHPFRPISRQIREGRPGESDSGLSGDLERFRLADLQLLQADRYRDRLSGGQCQRVSLLLAADENRPTVLLDEPLTDIDAFSRVSIEELLIERLFNRNSTKTAILVSHSAHWLKRLDGDLIRHWAIEPPADEAAAPQLTEQLGDRKLALAVKALPPAGAETTMPQPAAGSTAPQALPDGAAPASAPSMPAIPDVPVLSLKIMRRVSPGGKADEGFQLWPMRAPELENGIEVKRGEGVALYGLSGSGKSFLLRCMAGLWSRSIMKSAMRRGQHDRAQGLVTVDLGRLSAAKLASNIQYIFQNNRGSVSLSDTLADDLASLKQRALKNSLRLAASVPKTQWPDLRSAGTLKSHNVDAFIDTMIAELWERLQIPAAPLRNADRFKLSGLSLGMLRRYTLIRALIKLDLHTVWTSTTAENPFSGAPWQVRYKPRVLLADEVSRGLDPDSLFELGRLISDLKRSAKLSVVIVSHENSFTAALAERIYLVVDGFVMPTPLTPARLPPDALSDVHAFAPGQELPNPIYELYCSRAKPLEKGAAVASAGAGALIAPDTLSKLAGRSNPGCVVHGMLQAGPRGGCPNHGSERCLHAKLVEQKAHGVCV